MSDRITVIESVSPATPVSAGPPSGRGLILGQTGKGPVAARIVRGLGEYERVFGSRTGGAAMYDAALLAFASGISELVVQRATGPAPVNAAVVLDAKITVTAKDPGAFANAWKAAYDAASKTLTITGDTVEAFIGATVGELVAAAAASTQVNVAVTALPLTNVAETALSGGTDDFDNVVWATELGRLSVDFGPGVVWVPGVAHTASAAALAAHCATTGRIALVTAAAGSTKAQLKAAAATVSAVDGAERLVLVGPWVRQAGRVVDPCGFAAGLRAMAHVINAGENPRGEEFAKRVFDVAPEVEFNSADWAELDAAGVSVIRTVYGVVRLFSWQTAKAMGGNANLKGAQRRDLVNAVRFGGERILAGWDGKPATSANMAQIAGQLEAFIRGFADYLNPRLAADGSLIDPGFRVEVSTGIAPADNVISARIALRLAESIDEVIFTIAVGDAGSAI